MKVLHFTYQMTSRFDQPVSEHYIFLRCFPQSTVRQQVENVQCAIDPQVILSCDDDHFGNHTASGRILSAHSELLVAVSGQVRTGLDIYEALEPDRMKVSLFRYATPFTRPGEALSAYFQELQLDAWLGTYEKALHIMQRLAARLHYEPGVTDIRTLAEDAFVQGNGVCQDYAHIMLALCRMAKIPARYVVGLLQGEGVTHAWVEVWCQSYWYGFDPTNNLLVNDDYIKFSHGRDYEDCLVNKGFFIGGSAQQQQIGAL
ncbi:MAG: transglutaminase family protein, partial [Peptococcaceae bacterium]|nr:transglutaminase family protein [Peptococcaceae bacterium]